MKWLRQSAFLLCVVVVISCEEVLKDKPDSNATESDMAQPGCCSVSISDRNFRLTNPSYPYSDAVSRSYSHYVKIQNSVCGLRMQFEYVYLEGPALGSATCSTDSITIIIPGRPTQPNCGVLTNFQINVPVKSKDQVEILIVTQSRRYYWNIIVNQLACSSIPVQPSLAHQNKCGKRPEQPDQLPDTPSLDGLIEQVQVGANFTYPDSGYPSCPESRDYLRCYLDGVIDKKAADTPMDNRIINGKPAKRQSWPWQVALLVNGKKLLCGGALISPTMVVTAGHCLSFVQKALRLNQLQVVSGAHRLGSMLHQGTQSRKCEAAVLHEQYADVHHDISICILDKPMVISETVSPVCLPNNNDVSYAGREGYITGWGKTRDNGGPSPILQEAIIPIVRNQDCRNAWVEEGGAMFSNLIDDFMICGGGRNKSTCNGDSGGPLSYYDPVSNTYTLIGLTSFGPSAMCNVPFKPLSVFTRISSFVDFIAMAEARVTGNNDLKIYFPGSC